jgi:hypothetical protein
VSLVSAECAPGYQFSSGAQASAYPTGVTPPLTTADSLVPWYGGGVNGWWATMPSINATCSPPGPIMIIDGDSSESSFTCTQTKTAGSANPWFAVDFGAERVFSGVSIWSAVPQSTYPWAGLSRHGVNPLLADRTAAPYPSSGTCLLRHTSKDTRQQQKWVAERSLCQ